MNATLNSRYYLQAAVTFSLLFFLSSVFAQTHTPRQTKKIDNVSGFYEYLPQGYNDDKSTTYPLLIFVHGIGELDDGTSKSLNLILRHGPPKLINNGTFPKSFMVNGQTFKFIVLSPQFIGWPTPPDVQGVIDYALKNYRVNTSRVYLTGLSMGGGVVWDYAGSSKAAANSLAAIVPICGVSGPIIERVSVFVNTNLPIWATHNLIDPSVPVTNTISYFDQITALAAILNPLSLLNPVVKKTIFPVEGHDAWSTTYDPNYRENGKNIYEWMLSYSRGDDGSAGRPAPAQNKYPSSVAGADQTITLPTSNVTLSGSGSDEDGSISAYSWTQLSGPSQSTINSGNSASTTVSNLKEGDYVFRFTVTDNAGANSWSELNVKVNAAIVVVPPIDVPNIVLPSNPPASPASIPGIIQAETYSNMSGVGIEKTSDEGGGASVGWIDRGDWFDYNVNVATSGNYTVNFRVASIDGGQFQVKSADGSLLVTVSVPQTGGFQSWKSIGASIYLNAGTQTLRIISAASGNWNINWADYVLVKAAATEAAIPGKIETENYNSMNGVINEPCNDVNGGLDVGWIEKGDWMDYNVNVATSGTYTVNLRVASPYDGQQLQIKTSDGTVLTTANIPETGSFQTWKTMTTTISLKAGTQTLRIYSAQNGWWNINWADFVLAQGTSGFAIPGKIENENYNAMYGVLNEYSNDDGGQDVGWIEQGDWMDYNVSVSSSGYYTINFRVSSPFAGQQLQLKTSDGTVLTNVNLPQTGSFQIWRTATATNVYLQSGNQTLRVYTSKVGWWDINWMDFVFQSRSSDPVTEAERTLSGAITSDNIVAAPVFSIYPNPVKNMFTMQIRNKYTGLMNVKIVNQLGSVVKQFKLAKDLQESQLNLSIKELPTGTYFIKVQVGEWSESKKLIKL